MGSVIEQGLVVASMILWPAAIKIMVLHSHQRVKHQRLTRF